MKIITAFDSFKGCLSAKEACLAAASGIKERFPDAEIINLPMSDGGEGMVDCIAEALDAEMITVRVHDPLMQEIDAQYAYANGTAYMEMAAASGLTLVPEEKRNPMLTTTHGVGEMILDAIRRGCERIVMGIGGSATCDGGEGMISFLKPYLPLPIEIIVASDVSNPLYGECGAAYVFAPQKGATPEQVLLLEQRLRAFARQTVDLGFATPALENHPGAGAAGGLGYGLMAYLDAKLTSGIDLLLDTIQFNEKIADADLILTGEGKTDSQTSYEIASEVDGHTQPKKVPMGILKRGQKQNIPVLLLSGCIEEKEALLKAGFINAISINEGDERPLTELIRPEIASANMKKAILSYHFSKLDQ